MKKLELNDKLAELYGLDSGYTYVNENKYSDSITTLIIDDWSVLMDLAVDKNINYICSKNYGYCKVGFNFIGWETKADYKDHESPQAATRFAIAMALVKLKEDK